MKENIDQIRKRHEKEIEDLQSECKHEDVSDWMMYQWAPGHFSHNVKACLFCGKIVRSDAKPFVPIVENIGG